MTIPAARQLAISTLQDLGVESPVLIGEATLLRDSKFAGRRFDFEGGFVAAWLQADGLLKVWGPQGLLQTVSASAGELRRAA